jgi:hypothetical protein
MQKLYIKPLFFECLKNFIVYLKKFLQFLLFMIFYNQPLGGVAQLVERLLCTQEVAGSIPVASTIFQVFSGVFSPVYSRINLRISLIETGIRAKACLNGIQNGFNRFLKNDVFFLGGIFFVLSVMGCLQRWQFVCTGL